MQPASDRPGHAAVPEAGTPLARQAAAPRPARQGPGHATGPVAGRAPWGGVVRVGASRAPVRPAASPASLKESPQPPTLLARRPMPAAVPLSLSDHEDRLADVMACATDLPPVAIKTLMSSLVRDYLGLRQARSGALLPVARSEQAWGALKRAIAQAPALTPRQVRTLALCWGLARSEFATRYEDRDGVVLLQQLVARLEGRGQPARLVQVREALACVADPLAGIESLAWNPPAGGAPPAQVLAQCQMLACLFEMPGVLAADQVDGWACRLQVLPLPAATRLELLEPLVRFGARRGSLQLFREARQLGQEAVAAARGADAATEAGFDALTRPPALVASLYGDALLPARGLEFLAARRLSLAELASAREDLDEMHRFLVQEMDSLGDAGSSPTDPVGRAIARVHELVARAHGALASWDGEGSPERSARDSRA